MRKALEVITYKIRQAIKDRQFEYDAKGISRNIISMLTIYRKINARYYNQEERKHLLKCLKNAEKSIAEISKKTV